MEEAFAKEVFYSSILRRAYTSGERPVLLIPSEFSVILATD